MGRCPNWMPRKGTNTECDVLRCPESASKHQFLGARDVRRTTNTSGMREVEPPGCWGGAG
eukprot:6509597-Alexandrium_andersonii.AAC.1